MVGIRKVTHLIMVIPSEFSFFPLFDIFKKILISSLSSKCIGESSLIKKSTIINYCPLSFTPIEFEFKGFQINVRSDITKYIAKLSDICFILTLCMLGNSACFLPSAEFFQK